MADYREARALVRELGLRHSWTNTPLVREALNRGVEVTTAARRPRIIFRHGGVSYRWDNGLTNLNSPLARRIGNFKDVQSRIFRNFAVNAPENAIFSSGEIERAWEWGRSLGTRVIKTHNGTHGTDVHVGIDTWEDFKRPFEQVSEERDQILVEDFHSGVEHRCLVVHNKLAAVTADGRPASKVTGSQP